MPKLIISFAVLLTAAACQRDDKGSETKVATVSPAAPAAKPALPAEPAEPLLDPAAVKWKAHEVPGLGMKMNTIEGVEVRSGTFNQGANYTRQDQRPLVIAIWHGEGRTLESWRRSLSKKAEFSDETAIQICGRPARRQEARVSGSRVRNTPATAMALDTGTLAQLGAKPSDGATKSDAPSAWREVPPRIIVAVAFEHNGSQVITTFAVETDQREAFRRHEEQYFAGLTCD